jgi:hypothetical protein
MGETFWKGSVAFNEHLMHAMHEVPAGEAVGDHRHADRPATSPGGPISRKDRTYAGGISRLGAAACTAFLLNKWYWDELYNFLFVKPAFALGRIFWKGGDEAIINRFGPDGRGSVVVPRQPLSCALPVGLSLHLCARDAARPQRRRDLGHLGDESRAMSFPILSTR